MFEIEFLELLNNYKGLMDGYEKNKTENSILNMIKQNPKSYQEFSNRPLLGEENTRILEYFENKINEEKEKAQFTSSDDVQSIRNHYTKWLEFYRNNNNEVNDMCENIIKDLLNTYFKNRYAIIEKVLEVKQDEEYEAFKWHIKNQLRAYFANEIDKYIQSEEFEKLGFLKKHIKQNRLKYLLREITDYKFDRNKIEEVIQNG